MTEQWRLLVLCRWWLEAEGRIPAAVLHAYLTSLGRRFA